MNQLSIAVYKPLSVRLNNIRRQEWFLVWNSYQCIFLHSARKLFWLHMKQPIWAIFIGFGRYVMYILNWQRSLNDISYSSRLQYSVGSGTNSSEHLEIMLAKRSEIGAKRLCSLRTALVRLSSNLRQFVKNRNLRSLMVAQKMVCLNLCSKALQYIHRSCS